MTALRTTTAASFSALALGIAACGGGGGDSDSDQVKDVATQLATANPGVCSKVTKKFLTNVGGSKANCEKGAKASKQKDAKVGTVKVDGDKATAQLSQGSSKATIEFVKEDGDWKIDGAR